MFLSHIHLNFDIIISFRQRKFFKDDNILSIYQIIIYSVIQFPVLVVIQIYDFPIAIKVSSIAFYNSSLSELFNLLFYSS